MTLSKLQYAFILCMIKIKINFTHLSPPWYKELWRFCCYQFSANCDSSCTRLVFFARCNCFLMAFGIYQLVLRTDFLQNIFCCVNIFIYDLLLSNKHFVKIRCSLLKTSDHVWFLANILAALISIIVWHIICKF